MQIAFKLKIHEYMFLYMSHHSTNFMRPAVVSYFFSGVALDLPAAAAKAKAKAKAAPPVAAAGRGGRGRAKARGRGGRG